MLNKISFSKPYRIAIIGGGQLGKMLTVAAKQLGFHVTILDPTPASPASQVADCQIVAAFTDGNAIRSLAKKADVVTYEFEHIDCSSLLELEAQGYNIFPTPKVLEVIQDKLLQKQSLKNEGIPVPAFRQIDGENEEEIKVAADLFGYPFLLKACTGGYDGKGNFLVQRPEDIIKATEFLKNRKLMAEKFVPYICEISVMVARSQKGEVKSYPLSENEHRENILHQSIIPARVSKKVALRAQKVAETVISHFTGIGIFCVEMFVTNEEDILVNEVAPRPHNSGHYTIEACTTSQFEQHIRAITGLPLGDTSLNSSAVMINLLGERGSAGPAVLTGYYDALSLPGIHLHVYGKTNTTPNRKMGHLTVTSLDLDEALKIATKAYEKIRIFADKEGD